MAEGGDTTHSWETDPDGAIRWLEQHLPRYTQVVCEDFRLYADKVRAQGYSRLETVKLIGVIEYLCRKAEIPCELQPASIQGPTRAILKARGVTKPKGCGPHAWSARLHLAHWYLRQEQTAG